MNELDRILSEASAAIEERYFKLPIDGGEPVYRERVYCYELYHQMRLLWPADSEFTLNGEVDKRAHPIIQELGAANAIPDFLVHIPGTMARNHSVIEVKSVSPSRGAIRNDLQKIAVFHNDVGYQRGVYLIFGEGSEGDNKRVQEVAQELNLDAPFELWIHSGIGVAAKRVL